MFEHHQDIIRKFPAIIAFIVLCLGIIIARYTDGSVVHVFAAGIVVSLVLTVIPLRWNTEGILSVSTAILFFCLGGWFASQDLNAVGEFSPPDRKVVVHATVSKIEASGPNHRIVTVKDGVDIENRQPLPRYGRLYVRDNPFSLLPGDRIAFRSVLRKPRNRGNPGEYNWELFRAAQGIAWSASCRGNDAILLIRQGSPYSPARIVGALRAKLGGFVERHSKGQARAVLKTMIVGDRGGLYSDEVGESGRPLQEVFADAGLAHLLSASGLHMGICVSFAILLTRLFAGPFPGMYLRFPSRRIAAAMAVPIMIGYCLLVGARVPTVRAAIMGSIAATAILVDRRWYSPNSLGLAGILILLHSPLSLFTAGFQLSFVAVAGIIYTVPKFTNRVTEWMSPERVKREQENIVARLKRLVHLPTVSAFIAVPVAAAAAVAPVSVAHFGTVPLYGVFANIAATALLTIALPIALVAGLVGTVLPMLGAPMLNVAELLIRAIIDVAFFFADLPGNRFSVPQPGMVEIIATMVAGGTVLFFVVRPTVTRALTVAAVLAALVGMSFLGATVGRHSDTLSVTFLNVGNGDACYVQPPGAPGILIDGGVKTPYFDAGRSIVVPFLKWSGVNSLGGIVVSHAQMDHIGGIPAVLALVDCPRIWINSAYGPRPQPVLLVSADTGSKRPFRPADHTVTPVKLGRATMTFLNPPAGMFPPCTSSSCINNRSVVCRIEFGGASFLFTGDLELEGEKRLFASGVNLKADVLKVPHHGCGSSTSLKFLRAVSPKIAVVSAGGFSHNRCPDPRVMDRLHNSVEQVYCTGRDGALTIRTDGKTLSVRRGIDGYPGHR